MRLLILGGPKFLGRHLIEAALARGHAVTLFNRGQTNPELFPEVEKLRGDRNGNLAALRGRRWDAVIDTCGYAPRIVNIIKRTAPRRLRLTVRPEPAALIPQLHREANDVEPLVPEDCGCD